MELPMEMMLMAVTACIYWHKLRCQNLSLRVFMEERVKLKALLTDLFLPFEQLLVWNSSSLLPVQQYSDHLAAVKAIAWSPHQHGLLASGGGTADRCLRFWNTLTGQALQSTDTGSQVCNLAWSKHANELVRRRRHALPNTLRRDVSTAAPGYR